MNSYTPHVSPGVMHIHSVYSDGTGTIPEIVEAAQQVGLEWMIVTDHDTLRGQEHEGWHGDLLTLFGHEVTPFRSHFLALGVDRVISRNQRTQAYIDETYERGGFGIMAHPDDHEENISAAIHPWEDWSIDGPSQREGRAMGIELWNLMSDWRSKTERQDIDELLKDLDRVFTGPTQAVLSWWDRLNRDGRRTFGIGGLDAHAMKRTTPGAGTTIIFPYQWAFGTLTNYLLLDDPLNADLSQARQQVYRALQRGRSYFVNRLDGDAPALPLMMTRGEVKWYPGDNPTLTSGPLMLQADGGAGTELRLIHNGELIASATATIEQQIDQPGFYRLEGHRTGRPWLFTNPIFVHER
jgi:hypothetical protein